MIHFHLLSLNATVREFGLAGGCNTTNAGPAGIVLLPPISHAEAMAEDMELELKDLIAKWRNNKKGLSTVSCTVVASSLQSET